MIRWIRAWWNERRRRIDESILWPACLGEAATIEDARTAFFLHTLIDPAWSDLTDDEKFARIGHLPTKP